MFTTIPFRMGVHTTIPFYVDMVRAMQISINGIDMIINAEQSTEIQCAVAVALQEALMVLSACSNAETDKYIDVNQIAHDLILTARNGVETHIHLSAQNVEMLAMVIAAYETNPHSVIDVARNAIFDSRLTISAQEDTEVHPAIQIENIHDDLVLTVANGIEIPITKALRNINNAFEFDLSRRVMRIKNWDVEDLQATDEWKMNQKIEIPFELALDIDILEDDHGVLSLVLRASDDVNTVVTHPVVIGTIDPERLSELDPFFIPDSTSD